MVDVSVVQPRIPHYRIPFFDRLALEDGISLSVIHAGHQLCSREGDESELEFDEYVVCKYDVLGILSLQVGLKKLIRDSDVVVGRLNARSVSDLAMARRNITSRLIYWGHGYGKSSIANRVRLWMVRQANAAILYDHKGLDMYRRLGVPMEKLYIAPNTLHVPNSEFNPSIHRHSLLFVGRLQKRKRVDLLLKAFSQLRDKIPKDITVEIVGDGPLYSELQKLADRLNITERTTFWGRVTDHSMLKKIFSRALAYVSPGHVGLGVLHSFAYGIPVITSQGGDHAPEVSNIEHGVTGFYFDDSLERLLNRISDIVTNDELSVEVGKKCYEHYRSSRTIEDMVEGFVKAVKDK